MFFVMLTSQLRECKQMEGCVPQGGTAPRASNCKIGFMRIFICEQLKEPPHSEKEARALVLASRTENAVANALALKNVKAREERGNLHTSAERAKISSCCGDLKKYRISANGKLICILYKSQCTRLTSNVFKFIEIK
jgi:hypothetical protein